jgi:methionine synthase II (cobalamin-independent)
LTDFLLALTGIHPRSEKTTQATQDWERQRIDSAALNRQFEDDVRDLIGLQESLSFDYVSDGQLTTAWQDLLTPIVRGATGVRKGPLVRWFNTNTFYYVPIIEGPISVDRVRMAKTLIAGPIGRARSKVVLADPLTFVECSEDRNYGSREALIFAYCDCVLAPVLRGLESAGVSYVQFSAPSLVAKFRGEKWGGDELSQIAEGLRGALKGTRVRTGYQTFFGDAAPYLSFLLDSVQTDDIGFDLTETESASISATGKGIVAGVADARSSYVERPAELVSRLGGLPDKTSSLTLAPSSDLRYVPRIVADAKLRNLARARKAVS